MSARRSLSRRPKYGSSERKLTSLDATELVLRKFAKRKPMHCQDIAERAMREGWLTSKATRPGAPGWQLLSRAQKDIKKRKERGDSAWLTNPVKGYLGLADWERKASPTRSKKTSGVIYVLSNPTMKGYLKIGRATDLKRRMTTLNTGVPVPFHCEHARKVDNAAKLEKTLRSTLRGRVESKREFYQLDVADVIYLLHTHGEDVTPDI